MSSNKHHQNTNDGETEPVPPPRRRGKSKKVLSKGALPVIPKNEIIKPSRQAPSIPCPPPKPESPPKSVAGKENLAKAPNFCKKQFVMNLEQKLAKVDNIGKNQLPEMNGSNDSSTDNDNKEHLVLQKTNSTPKPKPRPRPSPASSKHKKPLPKPRPSNKKSATINNITNRESDECLHDENLKTTMTHDIKPDSIIKITTDDHDLLKSETLNDQHSDTKKTFHGNTLDMSTPTENEQQDNNVFLEKGVTSDERFCKDNHDYEVIPTTKRQTFRSEKLRSCSYENVPPPVKNHDPVRLSQSLPHETFPVRLKDSYTTPIHTMKALGNAKLNRWVSSNQSHSAVEKLRQAADSEDDDDFEMYVNMSDSVKKSTSAVANVKSEKSDEPLFGIRKRSACEISPENDLSEIKDQDMTIPYNVLLSRRRNFSLDDSYITMDSTQDDHYQVPSSPVLSKERRSHTVNCPDNESHFFTDQETGKKIRRPPPQPPVMGMRNTMKIRNMSDEVKDLPIFEMESTPDDNKLTETESPAMVDDLYSVPRDITDEPIGKTNSVETTDIKSSTTETLTQDGLYSVPRYLNEEHSKQSDDNDSDDKDDKRASDKDDDGEYVALSSSAEAAARLTPQIKNRPHEEYVDMKQQQRSNDIEDNPYSKAEPTASDSTYIDASLDPCSQTSSSVEGYETPRKEPPRRPPPPKVPTPQTGNSGINDVYSNIDSLKREMRETVHSKSSSCSGAAYFSDSETESEEEIEETKDDGKGKLYYIATEILSTERAFVDALKLLCEDFGGAVKRLLSKDPKALLEGAFSQIFLNIEQIYSLDLKFLQELEVRMKNWDEHKKIGDIIREYGHFLKIYTTYIRGYDHALVSVQENIQKMPKFASLVKEYERSPKFKSLKLTSFLLKPIQRIPSYRLLLLDYLKNLEDGSPDMKDITDGVKIVSDVAEYINESMKEGEKFQDVLRVQSQIINSNEIVKPGRYLIKEGLLRKLSRKDTQDRMFYLFTDSLLYCSSLSHNQYKLILEMPLSSISVHVPKSEDFQNEFSVISTKRSFMLAASTSEDRNDWMKALNMAISEVTKKLVTFGLKKGTEDPFSSLPSEKELGSVAPPWVPDDRVTMCMACTKGFTVYNRRHHCRACGKVVCSSCSSYEAPLEYMDNEAVRVCEKCFSHLYHVKIYEEPNGNEVDGVPQSTSNGSVDIEEMKSRFRVIKTKKRNTRARKSLPSKLTEVMADEDSTIDSGHLKIKKGKTWKKYWFVLKDHVLYTYKAPSDPAALDTMPVLGFDLDKSPDIEGDELVFKLSHKGLKEPVLFKAENKHLKDRWTQCLAQAITFAPT